MTATFINPAWQDNVQPRQKAIVRTVGLDWRTLPRRYWFGVEPQPVIIVTPAPPPPSSLTDLEWRQVKGCFPAQSRRRNGVDVRRVLDALLFLRVTRTRWVHLSKRFGSGQAIRKTVERWAAQGIWSEFLAKLPDMDLAPERARLLGNIAAEWSKRGERYAKAQT